MDNPSRMPPGGQRRQRTRPKASGSNPQLFDDTSTQQYGGAPPGSDEDSGLTRRNTAGYSQMHHPSVPPPQQAYGYPTMPGQYTGMPPTDAATGDVSSLPPEAAQYQHPAFNNQSMPLQPNQYVNTAPGGYDPNMYNTPAGTGAPYPGSQYLSDPMANMAMQYGQNIAGQGKDMLHKNLEKYVSTSKIKYYFAVDTSYVGRKLSLLVFPYAHQDWSIQYNQDEPVAPRYEINAPDLYIPVMAFVTYILLAGVVLGNQDRFSPEMLGITASTALVWMVIEILALLLIMYILHVTTDLKYLDLIAYCGYKYVGMMACLTGSLLFKSLGYYCALIYMSISLAFFLVRSLKVAIMPHSEGEDFHRGGKRRLYMLMTIALLQPLFMWWLTNHLIL